MASTKLYLQVALLALALFLVSLWSGYISLFVSTAVPTRIFFGISGMCLLLVSLVYFWILVQLPSRRQSLTTVTIHFLLAIYQKRAGKQIIKEVLQSCENPMKHQSLLLDRIIRCNGDTVYGRRYKLQDITSLEQFRRQHPLTNYEHFRPYVDRMMEGERDVLIKGVPTSYVRTTGTTGKSKHIPRLGRRKRMMNTSGVFAYIYNNLYNVGHMQKKLYFYVSPNVSHTKCGTEITSVTAISKVNDLLLSELVTPPAGYRICTMHEATYVHLLFGLLDPNVGCLIVSLVSIIETTMKLLERHWESLVNDVSNGTLNPELNLPRDIRAELSEHMSKYGGDHERAAQLQKEFENGFHGILRRVWPRLKGIIGVDSTGSWPKLSKTYAAGIDLLSLSYGASEGMSNINPGPTIIDGGYIPLRDSAVMEFIREEDMGLTQPRTYFLNEVEKGRCYEIVITQIFGFYRYRMGDVVRIDKFYKNMPVMQYMYRTGQMLNLRFEKLHQVVVSESVRAAGARWPDKTLHEFAAAESTLITEDCSVFEPDEIFPYYLFFLEFDGSKQTLSEEEKNMIDVELRIRNSDYERLRRDGSISRPRVHVVRLGAFETLKDYLLTTTEASANQYKIPRKLCTSAMLKVLLEQLDE